MMCCSWVVEGLAYGIVLVVTVDLLILRSFLKKTHEGNAVVMEVKTTKNNKIMVQLPYL